MDTQKQESKAKKLRKGLRLAKMIYLLKVFGLGLGFFFVDDFFTHYDAPYTVWWLGVIYAFVWPHISYQRARLNADPVLAENHNLLFDTFIIGVICAACHLNPLLSAVMFTMFTLNNMATGGPKTWLIGVALFPIGAAIGYQIFSFQADLSVTIEQVYSLVPIIVLYPTVIGLATYKVTMAINKRREEFKALSRFDGLTYLYGKTYWQERLKQEFTRSLRRKDPATLLIIDVDYFKAVNDKYGHHEGDKCLVRLASSMKEHVREVDICGRIGGDEFAVILPNCSSANGVIIANRIREEFKKRMIAVELPGTLSIGVAMLEHKLDNASIWYQQADKALYQAKQDGRDQVSVYHS